MKSGCRKRQRVVKNAIVETDDVDIEPGVNFANWIPFTREKLQQREYVLLAKRMQQLQCIIKKSIDQFKQECYPRFNTIKTINIERMNRINHEIYDELLSDKCEFSIKIFNQCNNKIRSNLSQWDGVKKSKKTIVRFRDYFKIARNTFDQQKINIITNFLWIPIIKQISKFSDECAAKFFSYRFFVLQRYYSSFLTHTILSNIMNGILKLPNCRSKNLIPSGSYYLFNLKNLVIATSALSMIDTETKRLLTTKKKGTAIKSYITEYSEKERNKSKNAFIEGLINLHIEVDNIGKKINDNLSSSNGNISYPDNHKYNGYYMNNYVSNTGYCNCHCQHCFNPELVRYRPY